ERAAATAPAPAVAPELLRAAEQRGYEAGLAKGKAAGDRAFEARLKQFDALLAAVAQKRDALPEVLEDDLAELVFEATAQIVRETTVNRELAGEAVRRALRARSDIHIVAVHVAPEDLALVGGTGAAASLGLGTRIKLVANADVALGGCIIETGQGNLDARLETQMAKLKAALLEGRSRAFDETGLAPAGMQPEDGS